MHTGVLPDTLATTGKGRIMRIESLLSCLLLGASSLACGAPPCDIQDLAWLVGGWKQCHGTDCTEERWMPARGGRMLGVNQQWGERRAFEFLRIEERGQQIVYVAQPEGGEATTFTLTHCQDRHAGFTNDAHDFPQRIAYRADGDDTIVVRISGHQDDRPRSMEWRWSRTRTD